MSSGFFGNYINRSAMKVAAEARRRRAEEERLAEEQAQLEADAAEDEHQPEQKAEQGFRADKQQDPAHDAEQSAPREAPRAPDQPVADQVGIHTPERVEEKKPEPVPDSAPSPAQRPARRLNWLVNFIEQEVADAEPEPTQAAPTQAPSPSPQHAPPHTLPPSPAIDTRADGSPAPVRPEAKPPVRPSQEARQQGPGNVEPNREASGAVGDVARRKADRPASAGGHHPQKPKPETTQRDDASRAKPSAKRNELTLPPLTSPDADELPPLPPSRLDIERGESPFEIDAETGFLNEPHRDELPEDIYPPYALPKNAERTVAEVDDIEAPEPDRLFGDGFAGRGVSSTQPHAPDVKRDDTTDEVEPAAETPSASTHSASAEAGGGDEPEYRDVSSYVDEWRAERLSAWGISPEPDRAAERGPEDETGADADPEPQAHQPFEATPPVESSTDAVVDDAMVDHEPAAAPPQEYVAEEPVGKERVVEEPVVEEPVVEEPVVAEEAVAAERPADAVPDAPINEALVQEIRRKDRVVAMLLRKEIVTEQHVANAQRERERQGRKEVFWRVLASLTDVDTDAVYLEAARVYAFKTAELGDGGFDNDFARAVVEAFPEDKREQLLKLRVLPYQAEMEAQTGAIKLVFATHDPTRPEVHRVMQDLRLERFELRYAPESIVRAFVAEAFPRKNEYLERMSDGGMRFDLGASFDDQSQLIDEDALEAEISRSSLINLFEATLVEAVRRGASDIHIYPNAQKHIEIHFRVDGRLGHWHTEEKVHPEALLAVIKDNAMNVDRFERDSAQDGFIQRWIDDALIRFRVSVLPIANAAQELRSESIVIRVLDDRKVITDLKKLGLLDVALERFEMAIRQPHGMVILTGPTGSGKSTTLVAAMHQVVTPEVNVLTVEDPVEYIIPGVRQIKLNHKLGLEEALRAILRHDPDVVMVGEMRDRQTADLAIKLANTGHLTFSTLHTNDAPSAISRLYKMGIEPFLIAYAINMVVAQRLIRTLCPACKELDRDPDPVMLKKLGFTDEEIANTPIYQTGHDPHCRSCKGMGYKGRRAVTEALYFSRPIRHMIVEAQNMIDEAAIRKLAEKEGMLTLRDSARQIVLMGETSVTEMIRVVTTES